MFKLYKKVSKSIENPKGAKEIKDGENPFEDGPCMLCVSAQDQLDRSIFGFTKAGARMARIAVNGDKGARINIDDVPANFLSIKVETDTKKGKESEESQINELVENYITPLLIKDGERVSVEDAMKKVRNINILTNCNGTQRGLDIIEHIQNSLEKLNYSEKDKSDILSQIALLSFQTDISLNQCKASVFDFHNLNDYEVEVNEDNINDNMIENNNNSKYKETIEKDNNRIEILIAGEDSHEIKDYMENGQIMPVMVHTIVSDVLENAIENSKGKHSLLSVDKIYEKADKIYTEINKGEKTPEEVMEKLDASLEYGGNITRLTDKDLAFISEKEQIFKELEKKNHNLKSRENEILKLNNQKNKMKETAKESCSETTYLKILQASGWNLSKNELEIVNGSELSDKELIEKQSNQISKLQKMLKGTLELAEKVKKSRVGKFFFGKQLKALPNGEKEEDIVR